jgi:ATP/maltotriose-dependent transcriptional regulator MalT
LASFTPATAVVAEAAAVLDGSVAPRHLAELTALPLQDVRLACDELVHARVLTGREMLAFAHPLVRAAIYEQLSPARRAATHRTAADMLDVDGQADRAALHLLAAERNADAGIVARLTIAAQRAASRGAVDEAVVLLSRALEEPPPPSARYAILMMLSQAEWHARDEAAVEHAYAALAVAAGGEQHEAAAIGLARLLSPAGRQQEAVDVLARAADELRDNAPDRAVRLDVQRVAWSLMLPQPPRELMQTVLSLSAKVEPGTLTAHVLNGSIAAGAASMCALPAADVATIALNALADTRMLEDLSVTAPFCWPLLALAYCERLDECSDWAERRRAVAARTGSRVEPPVLAAVRAHIAFLRGDLVAAEEEARAALCEADVQGFAFFVPYAAAQLVATLVERGEPEEAQRVLDDHGLAKGIGFVWTMLVAARVAVAVALALGDVPAARDHVSATPRDRVSLRLHPAEIAVAFASGAVDDARERAQAMLAVTERFGAPGAHGVAQRLLGLAIGGTEGLALLRAAVDSLERSTRRLELARAFVDYGAALRRAKQRAAARDPLRRGLDLAYRCGAIVLADHATHELRATGARPRSLVLTGMESLTPSELRVAQLVAKGRSNPEVAQGLFITRATVETHLRAVYRKLDVNRREQLAGALAA